ncbi:hypothetical protein HY285_01825 [Candidatus Peregrinibacteria bacterium]|nr:hypothetical protein [Candidatus Peregrinibacteria bacterium]MBI3816266.1 hypothetical protein [Candidatus Peregrinibacteria bacterium]
MHSIREHRLLSRQSFERGPEGLPPLPEFGNFAKIMQDFGKRMKEVWQEQTPETRREVTNVASGLRESFHGIVNRFMTNIQEFTPKLRPTVERLGGHFGTRNTTGIEWDEEDDVLRYNGHEFDFPVDRGHYVTVRIEHGDGTMEILELYPDDEEEGGSIVEGGRSYFIDPQGQEHMVDDAQMQRLIALEERQREAQRENERRELERLRQQMGGGRPPPIERPEQPRPTEPVTPPQNETPPVTPPQQTEPAPVAPPSGMQPSPDREVQGNITPPPHGTVGTIDGVPVDQLGF